MTRLAIIDHETHNLFIENVSDIKFTTYKGCTAALIFLIETERGKLQYKISGLNAELQSVKNC